MKPPARAAGRSIHILNTGGTISYGAPSEGGATLTFSPDRILDGLGIPGRAPYREVLRKGSVDMGPADWQAVGAAVRDAVAEGADGVVVFHGTDTMAYTAAALSLMLSGLPVPVVLTGSMRPGGAADSDAPRNVRDAVCVAATADLAEVCVVFSGDEAGTGGVILRGSRVRKIHSGALNAFVTPNHPPLGFVEGATIRYGQGARVPRGPRGGVGFFPEIDPDVCLIRYHPGCTAASVAGVLARAHGAVIEGTGLGHLPTEGGILEAIRESGKPVVLVSACWQGGVRLGLYDIDRQILAVENLIPGHDLTPEAALVKLMWVLGRERTVAGVRTRMQAPVAGDLTPV